MTRELLCFDSGRCLVTRALGHFPQEIAKIADFAGRTFPFLVKMLGAVSPEFVLVRDAILDEGI
jgi:hypothetical protein